MLTHGKFVINFYISLRHNCILLQL